MFYFQLLFPVITSQGQLRDSIVLVKVDLRQSVKPPRGNWKETCNRSLELIERCVYLDKDLVLPPMMTAGAEQTYFVVASTNVIGAEIMMRRMREQLEKLPELKASGALEISASAVTVPSVTADYPLEAQVREVADGVTETIRSALGAKQHSSQASRRSKEMQEN